MKFNKENYTMAINSTVSIIEKEETPEYPKLMASTSVNGLVVLFSAQHCGTIVNQGSFDEGVGSYAEDWTQACFKPLEGEITLSNK